MSFSFELIFMGLVTRGRQGGLGLRIIAMAMPSGGKTHADKNRRAGY
jgi:hypothetical protein